MLRRRLSIVLIMAALVFVPVAWLGYRVTQMRPAGPLHASAPDLTNAHLHTVERALGIAFPTGSVLEHATFGHGKDSFFVAQVTVDVAAAQQWAGPPPTRFTSLDPPAAAPAAVRGLPWAPETMPPPHAEWTDNAGTTLWISAPDAEDRIQMFIWRGGTRDFPRDLANVVYWATQKQASGTR